jgi:hypothetical protein
MGMSAPIRVASTRLRRGAAGAAKARSSYLQKVYVGIIVFASAQLAVLATTFGAGHVTDYSYEMGE